MARRIFLVVLDSAGIGALPDAAEYGDEGSNTLGNIAAVRGCLKVPNLARLGLSRLVDLPGYDRSTTPEGAYGRMAEKSCGKDTTTGHWELMGIILTRPFPTYPHGFPPEVIEAFEQRIGRQVLGNKPASGTVVIEELGQEHMATGFPIVYTSADSVFQIAAHEEVIPVEQLYEMCRIAREILVGEHAVGRVIARPFVGQPGHFVRTERRHDFSLKPPGPTALDYLAGTGLDVIAVGKINDIFVGQGITASRPTADNREGMAVILELVKEDFKGLAFANLVDFDMKYGHRNDVEGYARALEEFDEFLPRLMDSMKTEDILVITADHGCDPTTASTDHSREYVPVLVYGGGIRAGVDIGTRETFADLGVTVAELLGVKAEGLPGLSFAPLIRR
ncbi:MAG: phosphopentomutase [Syntrophothermus sp.]|uniref:phosphopentomutase n=1 Tax=Syntrophothermus sp. TaxID=2736299 RepID=UPI00257FBB48|nr:phosphopentomutase [Syntrophothermus sp.]NSW82828.1 phosphopentomutase [Syntrophothermus sp.]